MTVGNCHLPTAAAPYLIKSLANVPKHNAISVRLSYAIWIFCKLLLCATKTTIDALIYSCRTSTHITHHSLSNSQLFYIIRNTSCPIRTTMISQPPKLSVSTKANNASPSSIWTRKRDLLYLAFFVIHIPIVLCTSSLLPPPKDSPHQTTGLTNTHQSSTCILFTLPP